MDETTRVDNMVKVVTDTKKLLRDIQDIDAELRDGGADTFDKQKVRKKTIASLYHLYFSLEELEKAYYLLLDISYNL